MDDVDGAGLSGDSEESDDSEEGSIVVPGAVSGSASIDDEVEDV